MRISPHGPARPEIARWGSLDEIRHNWEENFIHTEPFIGRTISDSAYEAIRLWVNEEIEKKAGLFDHRAREGRIVDGHGDVRCESVCVTDDATCIYDCIEFNDLSFAKTSSAFSFNNLGKPDITC